MKVYFTFDYELFLGKKPGTVENCLLKPTRKLIEIAKVEGCRYTFFVDAGYLSRLKELAPQNRSLEVDLQMVTEQLRELRSLGHSLQLHVHPHWEDCTYDESGWKMDSSRYRLQCFSQEEIFVLFKKYHQTLLELTGVRATAYRAGGWCLQPFEMIGAALRQEGITLDSTVYAGGYLKTPTHFFDFREVPNKDQWTFFEDPTKEDHQGPFTELPISSLWIAPWIYSRLALSRVLGKKRPEAKSFGDGVAVGGSLSSKLRLVLCGGVSPVTVDGVKVLTLRRGFKKSVSKGHRNFVVIGHPKALSEDSLREMSNFIRDVKGLVEGFYPIE